MVERWELPNNKHTWAFYYFLKRKGDTIIIVSQSRKEVILERIYKHGSTFY
jgi:hypothetical protein